MNSEATQRQRAATLNNTEEELRAEIERLRRELESKTKSHGKPSRGVLWLLGILVLLLIVGGFFAGYLPRQKRESMLVAEASAEQHAAPEVNVVAVERSSGRSELVLPGNIQAVTEAPVLARASGYLKQRYADIGDRVKAGQLLAEIEAPELDQQIKQAKATIEQAGSSLEQANANLQQGRTNSELSRITAERWSSLAGRGVVSRQENDRYQAEYEASKANVRALEKAVSAARSNVAAAEASLARLNEMQGYQKVRAPFAGVITLRNIEVGTLINEGNTLLFRIAQTDRLRTYVNVPQADAQAIRVGQAAKLRIPDLTNRLFTGEVTRTANALDPATRTLLTEVQVPNPDGALMPGMYADVDLTTPRSDPPMLIPGDTLVIRSDGPQVARVMPDKTVHFQHIQLGRDYGDRLEVLSGLEVGQQIIVNPGDSVREKTKVNPVALKEKPATRKKS
jgi:multidrug efflux pump subunit AcrA (membrane-fusion protein)